MDERDYEAMNKNDYKIKTMEAKEFLTQDMVDNLQCEIDTNNGTLCTDTIELWLEEYANTKAIKVAMSKRPSIDNKNIEEGITSAKTIKQWIDLTTLLAEHCLELDKYIDHLESNQVKWIPIDKDNLPKGEVLAMRYRNNKKEIIGIVDYIDYDKDDDVLYCLDNNGMPHYPTHYINKITL